MEEIHTRCAFRPFCTQTYEDPPRDSKYNCNKCIGHYVSEKIEKVDKDASKPKRRSQNFTFHRLGNGGFYEGVSETVTYYDNRRRRPEAPDEGGADELGDDPPREPGHKGSRREKGHGRRRRRRSRREGDGEADGGVILVEEFEHRRSPVREDASLVPGAASNQLPPLPSSHGGTHVSRNSAQSG